jgi:alkylated DNA repair protein (DNA oxidative demethylase)
MTSNFTAECPPEPTDGAAPGFGLLRGRLDVAAQAALVGEVLEAMRGAPFVSPVTPWGRPMSVKMTSFGALGWTTDAAGYRYAATHPLTGRPWPPIPERLLGLWAELADTTVPPDSCLVNLYRGPARMALHQDRDEADFSVPVLSVSLGDTAIFRLGGPRRRDPSRTVRLASGDVCGLSGDQRLAFHGVDRVIAGSSDLIPGGGRINLTLRRAAPA